MSQLHRVILKRKALKDYELIIGAAAVEEITAVARSLQGLRLLHINSSASGGGVAELLNSLVSLEVNVGIQAEWRVLAKNERFFEVTKKIHNALQGKPGGLTAVSYTHLRAHETRHDL